MESSPSPSAKRRLLDFFSKSTATASTHRRSKNSSATAPTINMSDAGDQHREQERRANGFRAHFDSALEKLKLHESSSDAGSIQQTDHGDEVEDEDREGLGKKISKRLKSKKKKKEEETIERGRSVLRNCSLEDEDTSTTIYDERDPTPRFEQGDESSVMTYESDIDALPPPALISRPSHQGYLTLPLKQGPLLAPESDITQLDGSLSKASTFPLPSNAVATTEASEVSVAYDLEPPFEENSKRTPSPAGRLAAVLSPRRGSSPNSSPERSKASGRGGVFKRDRDAGGGGSSRRGSVVSKIGNIFPERPSSISTTSSAEPPRTAKPHPDLIAIPQTPPKPEKPAPLIVNTPPTPTDLSLPLFPSPQQQKDLPKIPSPIAIKHSNIITSPSGNMISHRRLRSGSGTLVPSKLSNITSAPLTPTPENGASSPQTGFFSTAWSAAQSAASTLTNSISNTNSLNGQGRSRSGTHESLVDGGDDVEVEILSEKLVPAGEAAEEKELAVKTLGMGDLSLSQFGITEATNSTPTPTTSKFPESEDTRGRSGTTESLPARLGTNSVVGEVLETGSSAHVEDHQSSTPVRDPPNFPASDTQTPPNGSLFEGKADIHRSGSVRSALGGRRRKRGSSAATGHTIGAAIAAANSSLTNPVAPSGITPKLTGFAVASKKRNRDFHQLFRSVPDDDYLIEDYSCALQKEILAHGRLYVSEGHLCFSSNILGWINTLVMSFDEIVSVEKRSTALVFRNGLMISTLHAKHIFASFTSRDMTYDLIVGIWKLGHPSLRSSLNGVRLDETGGDKTEKDDGVLSQEASNSEDESEEGDDVYDEDDDGMSFTQAGGEGSVVDSENGETVLSRKASATVVNGLAVAQDREETTSTDAKDYPGPATHPPTECTDKDNHYDRMMLDETIHAPLGKIYAFMFGPSSSAWMSRWLSTEQKCLEVVMEDKKGLTDDNKSRTYSYIKPLNGAIGPKSTKCITTETLDFFDLERSVSVTMSTQTPDVPSGGVFLTKTRYCLSWSERGGTRIQINCTIEWSGKSWLKGPIEKGATDGQIQYSRDLAAALRAAVSTKSKVNSVAVVIKGGKKKGRKGDKTIKIPVGSDGAAGVEVSLKAQKQSDWGMLEPLHDILKAIFDIVSPLISGNIFYGLVIGLLILSWFRYSGRSSSVRNFNSDHSGGMMFLASPERIAAYEEIWRREESELWEWLEDRVGMERLMSATKDERKREKSVNPRVFADKIGGNGGDDISFGGASMREIEDAIRVTEDKLNALKGAVEKRKGEKGSKSTAPSDTGSKETAPDEVKKGDGEL